MNEIEGLITQARRYCIDNHQYWVNEYSKKRSGSDAPVYSYSESDYNIFPRYNALAAILSGVEYIVGSSFDSIEECKKKLIYLCENTDSIFTEGGKNDIESRAIQEERDKFCHYIRSIEIDDLWKVPWLPHRRRLTDSERGRLRQELKVKWEFNGGHWFPLEDINNSLPVIFIAKKLVHEQDYASIKDFILENADGYLFEVTEEQIDYEIEAGSLNIDCYETIICDAGMQWLVYGSHESTLTFGGEGLMKCVERIFDDRSGFINRFPWD